MSIGSKPLARHRAVRALAEGARPSIELLADACGRSARMLKLDATREGWRLDRLPPEDFAERLRVIAGMLIEQVEALARVAAEGGRIDKAEIDGIIALIRGIDKIGEIMRSDETAKENQIRHDEDLAAVLGRINSRIIELARQLAAQMVAEQCGAGRGGPGEGGVVS